jgi:hypothetical protein
VASRHIQPLPGGAGRVHSELCVARDGSAPGNIRQRSLDLIPMWELREPSAKNITLEQS